MPNVEIGAAAEQKLLVDQEVAIDFLGSPDARVLSTPNMILCMERTCREALRPFLEPGHDSVGTHVNVSHLAAAPIGVVVSFTAEIVGVEDRRVMFRVAARSEDGELIGEGMHERTIVNVAKFVSRLVAKIRRT